VEVAEFVGCAVEECSGGFAVQILGLGIGKWGLLVLHGYMYESGDLLAGRKIHLRAVDLVRTSSLPIRHHFRSRQFLFMPLGSDLTSYL